MNSQAQQEGESIIGQDDEIHGGEKGRIERQHALRRGLVPAVAERVEAGRPPPRLTTTRKNAASASMRKCAPTQGRPSGQGERSCRAARQQSDERHGQRGHRDRETRAVDEHGSSLRPRRRNPERRHDEERGDAPELDQDRHDRYGRPVGGWLPRILQTHATAAALAHRAFADQLDPGGVERLGQLHQRIDITANHAVAGFHPLDRRQGKPGHLGKLALGEAEQGPGGTKLCGRNHVLNIIYDVLSVSDDISHVKNLFNKLLPVFGPSGPFP